MNAAELPPGVNPAPFGLPAVPSPTPETEADERRWAMTLWARYLIGNAERVTYTEGPDRWRVVDVAGDVWPKAGDCSSTVTALARYAGASDPNGRDFTSGYTGTMLEHCNAIDSDEARMGDLVVYGPGTGRHVVLIMERLEPVAGMPIGGREVTAEDFWVFSHGGAAGDPRRYLHSSMIAFFGGGSARFLRWLS